MEYCYKRFETCGETFWRILERKTSQDAWAKTPGTFDYIDITDVMGKLEELQKKNPVGHIATVLP
jgi:hypothetical protein